MVTRVVGAKLRYEGNGFIDRQFVQAFALEQASKLLRLGKLDELDLIFLVEIDHERAKVDLACAIPYHEVGFAKLLVNLGTAHAQPNRAYAVMGDNCEFAIARKFLGVETILSSVISGIASKHPKRRSRLDCLCCQEIPRWCCWSEVILQHPAM